MSDYLLWDSRQFGADPAATSSKLFNLIDYAVDNVCVEPGDYIISELFYSEQMTLRPGWYTQVLFLPHNRSYGFFIVYDGPEKLKDVAQ